MGGTDDPSNIIELTIDEHSEAHRKLYEEHGHWQDYLAWQGLSGRLSKEEIIREKISKTHRGKKLSSEHIEILREKGKKLIGDKNPMYGKKYNKTEETKKMISEQMIGKNKGKTPWNKGKTGIYSEEVTKIISEKAKKRHSEGKYDYSQLKTNMLGKQQTIKQKNAVAKANSKMWKVKDPEGLEVYLINLTKFCRENNLDQGNLSRGKYKGWTAVKLTSDDFTETHK